MISHDEYLERVVAGIQSVSTSDATVLWNDVINGRQFDVSVRFTLGTLRYLVLIEVKNRNRKSTVSDVEAFIIKARDQNANKSVFVTAAGFQEGAIDVAKKHGVDLFKIVFDEANISLPKNATFITLRSKNIPKDVEPELKIGEPTLVANIEKITLNFCDGQKYCVPDEQSQMNYYLTKTILTDGRTLDDLVQNLNIPKVKLNETISSEVQINPPIGMLAPDNFFFPSGILNSITYKLTGRNARPIQSNIRIDPNILSMPVVYTNVLTGESTAFPLDSLPLGGQTVTPGKFYFTCHPLAYFYCHKILGDVIEFRLVETFQNGDLVQAKIKAKISFSALYIPVTDKKILERLQVRLNGMNS